MDPKAINVPKNINYHDLDRAKKRIVAVVHLRNFPDEVRDLKEGKEVKASSKVIKLKPIMRDDQRLRYLLMPGKTFSTRPSTHWFPFALSSATSTMSPTRTFLCSCCHLCLSCRDGRYSFSQRFQK